MSTLAFQSHVPKILVAQIHEQISKQTDEGFAKIYTIQPQIRYFECALLFLDISGFTALSAAVSPEVLKNSINGYFSSIIEVVDKYHGDVIKFAGEIEKLRIFPDINDTNLSFFIKVTLYLLFGDEIRTMLQIVCKNVWSRR